MLLSVLASFLLARRFHGALYSLMIALSLGAMSLLSVGVPTHQAGDRQYLTGDSAIVLNRPLPLSYPIYASVRFYSQYTPQGDGSYEAFYQVYFLGFLFKEDSMLIRNDSAFRMLNFTMFDYLLFCSFFMLINVVGTAVGFRLSKARLKDKLLGAIVFVQAADVVAKRRLLKNSTFAAIACALLILGAVSLVGAFEVWRKYMWALEAFGHPPLFITNMSADDLTSVALQNFVVMFPPQVLLGLAATTCSLVLTWMKLIRQTSLAAATLLISSALMFFEASKIREIYTWASLETTTPPLRYYGQFLAEASYAYETAFPLYIQIGLLFLVFGLFLAVITIKEHGRPKGEIMVEIRSAQSTPDGASL